jgi:hypothetical protein
LALLASAACSGASVAPSPNNRADRLLGTWSGRVDSDVLGPGSATVAFNASVGPPSAPLLMGTWTFRFSNSAFDTIGAVTANLNDDGTVLGLTFDRSRIPCPNEPGEVADRAILANMTVSGTRMQGRYVAAGCPGGSLDLVRR